MRSRGLVLLHVCNVIRIYTQYIFSLLWKTRCQPDWLGVWRKPVRVDEGLRMLNVQV